MTETFKEVDLDTETLSLKFGCASDSHAFMLESGEQLPGRCICGLFVGLPGTGTTKTRVIVIVYGEY